jgi:ATP-binding cassette subfamily C exporter for protease/lipase
MRSFVLVRVGAVRHALNKRVYTAAFEQNLKQAGGNAGQALQDLTTVRQFLTGPRCSPSSTRPGSRST